MARQNLNIYLGVKIDEFQKGMNQAVKTMVNTGKLTEESAKQMTENIQKSFSRLGNSSTMKQTIRQMENLTAQMSAVGLEGTKTFNDLVKSTGKLKAEQQDLKDLIEASRPDAPFKALGTTLQAAAQGFAGLQGAMVLLGDESESTQKMMVKLQAALALVEGTKAIDGLVDGFTQLSMVVKANPIMAVTTAILAITVAVAAYNDELDTTQQITDKALGANLKEITTLQQLQTVLNSNTASREEQRSALQKIKDASPEHLGNLDLEKDGLDDINKAIKLYINLLGMKARAQAAHELYVEGLKKELDLQNEINKKGGEKAMRMAAARFGVGSVKAIEDLRKLKVENADLNKQFNEIAESAQKAEDALKKLYGKPDETKPTPTVKVKERKPIDFDMRMQGIGTTNLINPNALKRQPEIQMPEPRSIPVERVAELNVELAKVQITSEEVNASFQQLAYGGLTDIATAMGTAIATGQNLGQAIGQGLLRAMAGFMKQLGEMFIKAGLAKLAFDSAMISIGGAPLAIAAGTALVAASAAMTAKLQQANKPAQFAEGGLVPAGFSGDSFPALMSSGEAAIPLHNPRAMAKLRDGLQINSGIRIYGKFDGRDIYLANEKYSKDKRR